MLMISFFLFLFLIMWIFTIEDIYATILIDERNKRCLPENAAENDNRNGASILVFLQRQLLIINLEAGIQGNVY